MAEEQVMFLNNTDEANYVIDVVHERTGLDGRIRSLFLSERLDLALLSEEAGHE